MSVAPDFLLQTAPDVRPKAAVAKPPANAPEPVKNEASSFAEVYAKERQNKVAERKEAAAKSDARSADENKSAEPAAGEAAAEQPVVADSGKALPEEGVAEEESTLDPLLLMAMTGQLPVEEVAQTAVEGEGLVVPEGEGEASSDTALPTLPPTTPTVNSAAPATLTEASHDPELDMLNSLPGVRMALEIGAQNQAAAQQQLSPGALAAQKAVNPSEGFANALAAMAGDAVPAEEGESSELDTAELLGESVESSLPGVREGQTDARADALASKLSALSQAIAQQTTGAQRLPLVPGQAVAMQQGAWSEAVVDRVMWLSSQNLKSAEIQLDPAELGRLEVRIEMNKDQAAQVTFISANANVRDQLEGQMQRLRDMFTQQGIGQLDVNVSDQSLARGWQGGGEDSQRQSGRSGGSGLGGDEELLSGISEVRSPTSSAPRGLVDYYA
ncbi:flagellar hook-length control protein FliK [Aquipseudomonas guryensis]|uniref:Flagellar hook-length control protein FliK n=1 Tax=Aquipseudomonas guryensis TaxID=2759165 RepID=A0A7W4DBP9_9GAMM|nr:flagellar hook-length control protein FliK [Pseudomonas guryensis]MBB1519647.1 flagellar hook-length control protein FliK [Pseudomonas guryensis]